MLFWQGSLIPGTLTQLEGGSVERQLQRRGFAAVDGVSQWDLGRRQRLLRFGGPVHNGWGSPANLRNYLDALEATVGTLGTLVLQYGSAGSETWTNVTFERFVRERTPLLDARRGWWQRVILDFAQIR